jgi:hypothetical protein
MHKRRLVYAGLGVLVVVTSCVLFDVLSGRLTVRASLDLPWGGLPWSVRDIQCDSPFTTDVLTTCLFKINPMDVQALLVAHNFDERAMPWILANSRIPRPTGFFAPVCYTADPQEFEHGGHLVVCPDPELAIVLLDLYIE